MGWQDLHALDRLQTVLQSGHRPSRQRFNDAVAECDQLIDGLLQAVGADPIAAQHMRNVIQMRCQTVSLRDSFDTGEDTARYIGERLSALIMADEPREDTAPPQPVQCWNCSRVPSRYVILNDQRFCMECAEELGIRPRGKI